MIPSILFSFWKFIIIDGANTDTRKQNIQFNATFAMHIIQNAGNMYLC